MSPRGFPTNLLSYSDAVKKDVAEATAHFPRIIPRSPSPLMVPLRDPSLVIEYAGPTRGRNIYRWSPGDPPNAPIEVSSRSPSPGAQAWAPIEVTSRSPSPFLPGGPRATPAAGVESVPVTSWGEDPGSPRADTPKSGYSTPDYNYDESRPPTPPTELPVPSSSTTRPELIPALAKPFPPHHGCTQKCFDMSYTLHYHEHDKEKWTSAVLINDRTLNAKKVWGYGMEFAPDPKWEVLSGHQGPSVMNPTEPHDILENALKALTDCLHRGRCS